MKTEQKIRGFYEDVMASEKFPVMVPLVFCRVGRGGACVVYRGAVPVRVEIDINRCADPEYAILHEIAHIRMLLAGKGGGHHSHFKKEEDRLVDKYMYSSISFKHFA